MRCPDKFYTDLFESKQTSDYADFVYFDHETVKGLILNK